jgi:hypothetical protein
MSGGIFIASEERKGGRGPQQRFTRLRTIIHGS